MRKYGRPVIGDIYIAMDNGPVPSRVYDIVKGKLDFFSDPAAINAALRIDRTNKFPQLYIRRANLTPSRFPKRIWLLCWMRSFSARARTSLI